MEMGISKKPQTEFQFTMFDYWDWYREENNIVGKMGFLYFQSEGIPETINY